MATPTYMQLVTLSSAANGLQPESMEERILSVLAILVSGQNPDGSAGTGGVVAPLVLTSQSPTTIPLTLVANSGQTSDILDVYNAAGTLVFSIAANGFATQGPLMDFNQIRIDGSASNDALIIVNATTSRSGTIAWNQIGVSRWQVYQAAGNASLFIRDMQNGINDIQFSPGTASTGQVLFGKVIFPVQATTAAAPAYVRGGMYYDTTLNKLRIGGATAWETVSSA